MRTLLLVLFAYLPLSGQVAQGPPSQKERAGIKASQSSAQKTKTANLPQPPSLPYSDLDRGNTSSDTKSENRGTPKDLNPDRWMAILTAGLVVVGGLQVWVLARQTRIINESLAETRKATEHP